MDLDLESERLKGRRSNWIKRGKRVLSSSLRSLPNVMMIWTTTTQDARVSGSDSVPMVHAAPLRLRLARGGHPVELLPSSGLEYECRAPVDRTGDDNAINLTILPSLPMRFLPLLRLNRSLDQPVMRRFGRMCQLASWTDDLLPSVLQPGLGIDWEKRTRSWIAFERVQWSRRSELSA